MLKIVYLTFIFCSQLPFSKKNSQNQKYNNLSYDKNPSEYSSSSKKDGSNFFKSTKRKLRFWKKDTKEGIENPSYQQPTITKKNGVSKSFCSTDEKLKDCSKDFLSHKTTNESSWAKQYQERNRDYNPSQSLRDDFIHIGGLE